MLHHLEQKDVVEELRTLTKGLLMKRRCGCRKQMKLEAAKEAEKRAAEKEAERAAREREKAERDRERKEAAEQLRIKAAEQQRIVQEAVEEAKRRASQAADWREDERQRSRPVETRPSEVSKKHSERDENGSDRLSQLEATIEAPRTHPAEVPQTAERHTHQQMVWDVVPDAPVSPRYALPQEVDERAGKLCPHRICSSAVHFWVSRALRVLNL